MACLAQPVGNAGGFSYLYAVNDTNKIKVVGNYMPSNHDASRIVDTNGIAQPLKKITELLRLFLLTIHIKIVSQGYTMNIPRQSEQKDKDLR